MALEHPFTPAASGATPFRSTLPPSVHEDIVALVRSVHDNANEPLQALSVLQHLLRATDLAGTVPVWGLVSLIEPILAQLELLRADACTLNNALVPGDCA